MLVTRPFAVWLALASLSLISVASATAQEAPPAAEAPAAAPEAPAAPVAETPVVDAPAAAPETPATPEAPAAAPETPAAPATETPAAETPAPATEAPATETPATETPAPATPAPETPATEPPATETPAPETPAVAPVAPVEPQFREVVAHLDNPTGVVVHGGTGHIFIASTQGIFRFAPGRPGKIYLEVEGFPKDIYGKGPKYDIGALGVGLWGTDHLLVAGGSRVDVEEVIQVYKIGETAPEAPLKEAAAEFTLGPVKSSDQTKGEGNFYAIAMFKDAIYATANGDDTKGWIVKSAIVDGKPGELTLAIPSKELTEVNAPIALTVSPDGNQLLVSQGGGVNTTGDSLLTIYDAEGKLVAKYATGLHDIVGLAYAPNGKLYAVDFAWPDPTQGGLFELTIAGDTCTARKVLSLDRPTAIAFDKDGAAYITVFGTGRDTGDKPKGGLVRVEPGF